MSNDTHCANEDLHKERRKRQVDEDLSRSYEPYRDESLSDESLSSSEEESKEGPGDGVSNKICQMTHIVQTKTL